MQLQDDAAEPAKFIGIGGIFVKTILAIMTFIIIYGCSGFWYNSMYINVTAINFPQDHWYRIYECLWIRQTNHTIDGRFQDHGYQQRCADGGHFPLLSDIFVRSVQCALELVRVRQSQARSICHCIQELPLLRIGDYVRYADDFEFTWNMCSNRF